jgi:hypothetical protein
LNVEGLLFIQNLGFAGWRRCGVGSFFCHEKESHLLHLEA